MVLTWRRLRGKEYPRVVNFVLYILAEIAIAACDLAEVVGMAIGLELAFWNSVKLGGFHHGAGYFFTAVPNK